MLFSLLLKSPFDLMLHAMTANRPLKQARGRPLDETMPHGIQEATATG